MSGEAPAKARLLVISGVYPFPGDAGQQNRVYHKLVALGPLFETTFLTFAPPAATAPTRQALRSLVDHAIVLPSRVRSRMGARLWHKIAAGLHTLRTGLKESNYVLGCVELSPRRISMSCQAHRYDLVLYEYWHAHESLEIFQRYGIPCVLDMHDVLWQSYDRQLRSHRYPWMRVVRSHLVDAYRRREEAAWARFDALIAISEGEAQYARSALPNKPIIVAPMGADLDDWRNLWCPARPPRLAFYGSLGSSVNHESALWCAQRIMPLVWQVEPRAELWIVGANPTREVQRLQQDPRIHVTGFIQEVAQLLGTMTAVLCPWRGTYGFRSRLVEVMAVGVPVVATPDAVWGMGLDVGKGLLLGEEDGELADDCRVLLQRPELARQMSLLARQQIEARFSLEATYGYLAHQLHALARRRVVAAGSSCD